MRMKPLHVFDLQAGFAGEPSKTFLDFDGRKKAQWK